MRMIINKSNWSGEEASIVINKSKHTVQFVPGEYLKLKFTSPRSVVVEYDGHELCKGYNLDGEWYLIDGPYEGCTRTDKNVYVAAAQMAFNLI